MASTTNIILKNAKGHLGRQLVIKQYGDKTVISKFPVFSPKRKFTTKQQQAQKKMSDANFYAKDILEKPSDVKDALLRLNTTLNKLYTALIKEYFENTKAGKKVDKNGKWV